MEIETGHLTKIWEETYLLGSEAETDRDKTFICNLGVAELFQSGLRKHWTQLSLANYLLMAIHLS